MSPADRKGELNPLWVTFGARLKRARENAGFTQKQVAEAMGIHPVHLSRIENGESGTKRPMIKAAAKFTGWDMAEALGAAGLKPTPEEMREAGYAPSTNGQPTHSEEIPDAEFAHFQSRVKRLTPQQRRDFRVYWEMGQERLERWEKENREREQGD